MPTRRLGRWVFILRFMSLLKTFKTPKSTSISVFLVKVCLIGPEQDILHMHKYLLYKEDQFSVTFGCTDLSKQCSHCLLDKCVREGFRTDRSKLRHTRISLPALWPLLHWPLSDLSGHTCCHTAQCLDFRSMRESVTDLKDTFSYLLDI